LVIVNKLIKWGHFITCTEEILAENITQIYVKEVFAQHRSLEKIILNKDLKFVTTFWETFLAKQKVYIVTLTAYHPQTDGQTERLNQTLE